MVSLQARVPLLPPPSRVVSSPNSLPLPFRTPATRAIRVSAFATGLKKSPAYDLSQAQGRLLFCKIVHLLLFFSLQNCLIFYQPLELGTEGGAVVRALAPTHVAWVRRQMWVEFVAGFLPCSRRKVFLRVLWSLFLSP